MSNRVVEAAPLSAAKLCDTCGHWVLQFEYVCGRTECFMCGNDRQVTDPIYHRQGVVNEVVGVDRELAPMESSYQAISRSLRRERAFTMGNVFNYREQVIRDWDFGSHTPTMYEVVWRHPSEQRVHRRFFMVLPSGTLGRPWFVLVGNERTHAYPVRQWASGLLTTDELLQGALSNLSD